MLLRPATYSDVRAMAYLSAAVFIDDPIEIYLYPRRREYPEHFVDAQEELLRRSFERACGAAIVVALEPSDEGWKGSPDIVGFCVYTREGVKRLRPFIKKDKDGSADTKEASSGEPTTSPMEDLANSKAMEETCARKDSITWTEEGFELPRSRYEFRDLGVHPDFQGKGIGRMMAEWVQEKARAEGVPVHTISSPAGWGFYRRMGFLKVGVWKWCPVPDTEWDVMHWNPQNT